MTPRFRPAQAPDIAAIAALLNCEPASEVGLARQLGALKLMLAREDALLWVADGGEGESGKVIGFCSVQTLISSPEGGPVGVVEDLVVGEAWRRSGVGRRLLEGAEAWARRRGCTRLYVLTDRENASAQEFLGGQGLRMSRMQVWRRPLREPD